MEKMTRNLAYWLFVTLFIWQAASIKMCSIEMSESKFAAHHEFVVQDSLYPMDHRELRHIDDSICGLDSYTYKAYQTGFFRCTEGHGAILTDAGCCNRFESYPVDDMCAHMAVKAAIPAFNRMVYPSGLGVVGEGLLLSLGASPEKSVAGDSGNCWTYTRAIKNLIKFGFAGKPNGVEAFPGCPVQRRRGQCKIDGLLSDSPCRECVRASENCVPYPFVTEDWGRPELKFYDKECTNIGDLPMLKGMKCQELSTAPPGWTCDPAQWDQAENPVCDCGCGIRDPDCQKNGVTKSNCPELHGCGADNVCVYTETPLECSRGEGCIDVSNEAQSCRCNHLSLNKKKRCSQSTEYLYRDESESNEWVISKSVSASVTSAAVSVSVSTSVSLALVASPSMIMLVPKLKQAWNDIKATYIAVKDLTIRQCTILCGEVLRLAASRSIRSPDESIVCAKICIDPSEYRSLAQFWLQLMKDPADGAIARKAIDFVAIRMLRIFSGKSKAFNVLSGSDLEDARSYAAKFLDVDLGTMRESHLLYFGEWPEKFTDVKHGKLLVITASEPESAPKISLIDIQHGLQGRVDVPTRSSELTFRDNVYKHGRAERIKKVALSFIKMDEGICFDLTEVILTMGAEEGLPFKLTEVLKLFLPWIHTFTACLTYETAESFRGRNAKVVERTISEMKLTMQALCIEGPTFAQIVVDHDLLACVWQHEKKLLEVVTGKYQANWGVVKASDLARNPNPADVLAANDFDHYFIAADGEMGGLAIMHCDEIFLHLLVGSPYDQKKFRHHFNSMLQPKIIRSDSYAEFKIDVATTYSFYVASTAPDAVLSNFACSADSTTKIRVHKYSRVDPQDQAVRDTLNKNSENLPLAKITKVTLKNTNNKLVITAPASPAGATSMQIWYRCGTGPAMVDTFPVDGVGVVKTHTVSPTASNTCEASVRFLNKFGWSDWSGPASIVFELPARARFRKKHQTSHRRRFASKIRQHSHHH